MWLANQNQRYFKNYYKDYSVHFDAGPTSVLYNFRAILLFTLACEKMLGIIRTACWLIRNIHRKKVLNRKYTNEPYCSKRSKCHSRECMTKLRNHIENYIMVILFSSRKSIEDYFRNYARLRSLTPLFPHRYNKLRNEFLLAPEKQKRRRGEKRPDGSLGYKYIKSGNHPKWAPRYRIRNPGCRLFRAVVCRLSFVARQGSAAAVSRAT